MSLFRLLVLLLILPLLASCGVTPRAVVKRDPAAVAASKTSSRPAAQPMAGRTHRVVRGDTLYGIAFRHGLDYRDLARWNAIAPPYTIYPGQRLRLGAEPAARVSAAPAPSATTRASAPAAPPVRNTAPAAPAATPAAVPVVASAPKPVAAAPAPASVPPSSGSVAWRWPTSGQIIGKFVAGEPTRQGINIAGSAGQPVVAAAAGEVVYSGSGLIGYGELIIIRHSDTFLSAYGHNRKRLVAEGEKVSAGQQVAEMGRSGASRDMLHFEIRRNGKPIDPLPLLPAR